MGWRKGKVQIEVFFHVVDEVKFSFKRSMRKNSRSTDMDAMIGMVEPSHGSFVSKRSIAQHTLNL